MNAVGTSGAGARSGPLLVVDELKTHFQTERGLVRAVDGVSFTLDEGRTLGVVGESGCGKSVLSRSIMNLLPRRGVVRHGSVNFDGVEMTSLDPKKTRAMYGTGMAMIFQDPMTSLNPVVKIGRQLTESASAS
jgi:peptide/nickel transport system ATP-binding protein